jgi:hypothetical protein
MKKHLYNRKISRKQPGIVLLVTLVLLVVLATLGYTLSSRVMAQRHRNQYIIDYSKARYGCDSGVKYVMGTMEELNPLLISRPNEPDFSDLYALDEAGYLQLLTQWQIQPAYNLSNSNQVNADVNDSNNTNKQSSFNYTGTFDSTIVRGPYGPPWPFVTKPKEFEIGEVKVKIEIEDENAKYPLGWTLLNFPELSFETAAGFETFCEMDGLNTEQIAALRTELDQIGNIKPFKMDFKPITTIVKTTAQPTTTVTRRRTPTQRTTAAQQTRARRTVITVPTQILEQTKQFTEFFHSTLIDTETLARPNELTGDRKESPLKYMGIWGSQKVNINTAPRHVLEAAFTYGGNQVEIAELIIQRRRKQPFTDITELKNALPKYTDSISKCEQFITTESSFFTIKVTAVSGVAKASSVIAITKTGNKVQRIALING